MSELTKREFYRQHGMFYDPLMGKIFDVVEGSRAKPNGRTPFDIAVSKDVPYKTVDGETLYMDIYYPPQKREKMPLVMDIPGGGWMIHNRNRRDGYAKCFAQMGAVVAVIDHRLCPRVFFPENLIDCVDAYNFLVGKAEELGIDVNNITVTGDSSGGHLTACIGALATHPTYAEELGVMRPLTVPAGLIFVSGAFSFSVMHRIPFTHTLMVRYVSDTPTRSAFRKWKYHELIEPYNYLTSAFPPSYNNGGCTDLLCFGEAKRMAGKLSALGVENEYCVGRNIFNSAHCYMLRFPFASARRDALKLFDWYYRQELKKGFDMSDSFCEVEKFFTDYKKSLKGRETK